MNAALSFKGSEAIWKSTKMFSTGTSGLQKILRILEPEVFPPLPDAWHQNIKWVCLICFPNSSHPTGRCPSLCNYPSNFQHSTAPDWSRSPDQRQVTYSRRECFLLASLFCSPLDSVTEPWHFQDQPEGAQLISWNPPKLSISLEFCELVINTSSKRLTGNTTPS